MATKVDPKLPEGVGYSTAELFEHHDVSLKVTALEKSVQEVTQTAAEAVQRDESLLVSLVVTVVVVLTRDIMGRMLRWVRTHISLK